MINLRNALMADERRGDGRQIEYVDIGGYYFLTGYKPNNSTSFDAEFAYTYSASDRGQVTFGCRDGWQSRAFMFPAARPADRGTWFQWGNSARNLRLPAVTLGQRVNISIGKVRARAFAYNDSIKWTPSTSTFQCEYPFAIGETLDNGQAVDGVFYDMRFYSCNVFENGVLVVQLVPWLNNSGAGVKDLVSGDILEPQLANTQTYQPYLIAGPDI